MRKISRIFGAAGVAVAAMAATVVMAASPAQASSNLVLNVIPCKYCSAIGYGQFNADPTGLWPGDSLRACDIYADGWGTIAWMQNSNGTVLRTATTQGHKSNYCTGWQSGNLPEEKYVVITVCAIHGTETKYCKQGEAWA